MSSTSLHAQDLEHQKTHGSITSKEAINLYVATRLSAIIFCLRKKGLNIETEKVKAPNRYGRTVQFGRYHLRPSI